MQWLSHPDLRIVPVFLATVILVSLLPDQAGAGRREDALTLVRSGDIDLRIEAIRPVGAQAVDDPRVHRPVDEVTN